MIATILWPDANLMDVQLSFDLVVIAVRDSLGTVRRVRAEGYIHFEYDGAWDETIIAAARIQERDSFAQAAWQAIQARYAGSPPATGSPSRNSATGWWTLIIEFSDGAVMRCVAASFVEE